MRWVFILIQILIVVSCGTSSEADKAKERIGGWRYGVKYTRAADLDEWVPVKGTLEFWFFQAGVFRQIGSSYIEPQFFDQLQACNGSASGSFTEGETSSSGVKVDLAYDGIARGTKGLCRMAPRSIFISIQPSGSVDILDGKVALRLERIERIQ
jgi:hypothetical protein